MPSKPRSIALIACLLLAVALLAAACEVPVAPPEALPDGAAPTQAYLPSPTAATDQDAASSATEAPPTPAPPVEDTPVEEAPAEAASPTEEPTVAPTPAPQATETPVVLGDLGLGAGAAQLAAALGAAAPCNALQFALTTLTDGTPALVGISPDGGLIVEIVGPEDSPITASLAMLLPEGDVAAREVARAALYQLIGAAMPDRAWATAWLDERIEDALDGTPYSTTYEEHYVQVVRLFSPRPSIAIAVTLSPRTLAMPTWEHLDGASAATVEAGWDLLPIMPDPLRGQRLPTDRMDLYEYTVAATLEAVEAYYEGEMPALGWELADRAVVADPGSPGQQQIVLVYRRGAEGALVTIDRYAALDQTLVTLGYAADAADLPAIAG